MKRYNLLDGESYGKKYQMVEERDGDWVWWEDVEAQCAKLESKCAELLEALEWIAKQYDDSKPIVQCASDAYAMSAWAGAAIAKAKGEAL